MTRDFLVIAGLDPAIHLAAVAALAYWSTEPASLDRRVEPGDDTWVVPPEGI